MSKVTVRERFKYRIDNVMSKGTLFMIVVLSVLTIIAVVLIAFLTIVILKNTGNNFGTTLWETFLNILDPGTVAGIENTSGYLVFMIIATIMGLLMTSILIGLITSGFQSKIEDMRRGKSKVTISGHTLILGWDNTIFTIIAELIVANENVKRPHIVIMADRDITEMSHELKNYLTSYKNTRIVFRRGCLHDSNDLKMCNISRSKSAIILEEDDAQKIKVLMALSNTNFFINPDNYAVVILEEEENFAIANIIDKDNIVAIDLEDTVSKMVVQTATQPGLIAVYEDLISFVGDEIYFNQFKEAVGRTLRDVLLCFDKSSVIGIQKGKNCFLHPPLDTVIEEDDSIILISRDDDTARFTENNYVISHDRIVEGSAKSAHLVENILIVGYNDTVGAIIREFDAYLAVESKVIIYLPEDFSKEAQLEEIISTSNLKIRTMRGKIPDADAYKYIIHDGFTRIILLSSPHEETNKTDCDVLLSLLYLRKISDEENIRLSIIGEIKDVKNSEIAKSTRYHDFIVSSNICGMISSQLSENRYLKPILDDIFDEEGSEIYTKPVSDYVKCGCEMNYATLVYSAMLKGEICIGYMVCKGEHHENAMNPSKATVISFTQEDCVIVVAVD